MRKKTICYVDDKTQQRLMFRFKLCRILLPQEKKKKTLHDNKNKQKNERKQEIVVALIHEN